MPKAPALIVEYQYQAHPDLVVTVFSGQNVEVNFGNIRCQLLQERDGDSVQTTAEKKIEARIVLSPNLAMVLHQQLRTVLQPLMGAAPAAAPPEGKPQDPPSQDRSSPAP